jgi:hypothetical protein
MRISAAKVTSVMAVTAVAVLGAQYASAAPSHQGKDAQPNIAPIRNINYQYSTSSTGGTGDVVFNIPNPPNGFYAASFTANFFPQGSPAAPKAFACSLIKDGTLMRAQSTVTSASDSGFYVGVNGGNAIKIDGVAQFQMFCGTDDGSDWTWGSRPLQVNLVRLDGLQAGNLTQSAKKAGSLTIDGTR